MESATRYIIFHVFLFNFRTMADVTLPKTPCRKINSCSAVCTSNKVIDLSPLCVNGSRWTDVSDIQNQNKYSYNPCEPFSEGTCKNVAICETDGLEYHSCGTQDSAMFRYDNTTDEQLFIQYESTGDLNITRTSQVILQCIDHGQDQFSALGETAPGSATFLFVLSSTHCYHKTTRTNDSLSVGTILIIMFIATLVTYIVFGSIYRKVQHNATGKDILPNFMFWSELPGLIKDGFKFVLGCGKPRDVYERLET